VEYNNFLDFFEQQPHLTKVEQCDKIDNGDVV